jgi:hypothetical protein
MNNLGCIEDLSKKYVQELRDLNLVPLWLSLRAVLPPKMSTRNIQLPPSYLRMPLDAPKYVQWHLFWGSTSTSSTIAGF